MMQRMPRLQLVANSFLLATLLWHVSVRGEDAAATEAETDPTKELLKQLTIGMMEVVDERTVHLVPTGSKDKRLIHLRLGNVGPPPQGSLSDGEYAEKVNAAKAELGNLVDKQALWYKAAPDSIQPPSPADGSPTIIIADLWNRGGRHVNTALKKAGHLSEVKEYESEIARDILGAAAKDEKDDSYKKLGEAMAEHEKEKRAADKANGAKAKEREDADAAADAAEQGFGLAGWIGIGLVVSLAIGVVTNFGQPANKKTNLNRKKGAFEKWWNQLKGA